MGLSGCQGDNDFRTY